MRDSPHSAEDLGLGALTTVMCQELESYVSGIQRPSLRASLDNAQHAFADKDAPSAYRLALDVLEQATQTVQELESTDESTDAHLGERFLSLRELDGALLETSTLFDLLALGGRGQEVPGQRSLDDLLGRMMRWLVEHETQCIDTGSKVRNITYRMRQIRTLLHLVDATDMSASDRANEAREERLSVARLLLALCAQRRSVTDETRRCRVCGTCLRRTCARRDRRSFRHYRNDRRLRLGARGPHHTG